MCRFNLAEVPIVGSGGQRFAGVVAVGRVRAKPDGLRAGGESRRSRRSSRAWRTPLTQKSWPSENELYAKYQVCAQDAQLVPPSFFVAARECGASVSNLGSLFYEEMSCAGYDPQRRQFASPVKIKQTFGFGGAPLPGSREYVLHCVADAGGTLVPVGRDSVHLADAIGNQSPTWQFAVIVNANENLQTIYPMNGQTRRARSILSWALHANRLQLHADLGERAELPHPPRSMSL